MSERISGKNLVYARVGCADESQVLNVVKKALQKNNLDSNVYINVVSNKGVLCKYAYLWFTNPQAFDFIIGFGNQGFTMIESYVDQEIEPPSDNNINVIINNVSKDVSDAKMAAFLAKDKVDWAYQSDEDDYVVSKTRRVLIQTRVDLDKIEYTQSQKEMMALKFPNDSILPFHLTFDKGEIEDLRGSSSVGTNLTKSNNSIGSFSASTSDSDDSDQPEFHHNVWVAHNVPDFVNVKILRDALCKYVTDPNAKGRLKRGQTSEFVSYPHINIKNVTRTVDGGKTINSKSVYVVWNPNSTDGMFAIRMCRQIKIQKDNRQGLIYFNHHRCRARDE